jgi:hypothetical protein
LLYLCFQIESSITTKIVSGQCHLQHLKKLASTLALLPSVRVSQNTTSLIIQKLLIVVNNMLNETFVGLEEGKIPQLHVFLIGKIGILVPQL